MTFCQGHCPSSIKVILVKVGDIPQSLYEKYSSDNSPFKNLSSSEGRILFNFIDREEYFDEREWETFQIHRKPFAVIGYSSFFLTHTIRSFNTIKSYIPAFQYRCFAFEPLETQIDLPERKDLIMVPNVGSVSFYVSHLLIDLASFLLSDIQSSVTSLSETSKRESKILADYCLLIGDFIDAKSYYSIAIEESDLLWKGGSYEGMALALIGLYEQQLSEIAESDTVTDVLITKTVSTPLPLEEAVKYFLEALSFYKKGKYSILLMDLYLIMAHYYAKLRDLYSCFLHLVNGFEFASVYNNNQLGLTRKFAFYAYQVMLTLKDINYSSYYKLLLSIFPIYCLPKLIEVGISDSLSEIDYYCNKIISLSNLIYTDASSLSNEISFSNPTPLQYILIEELIHCLRHSKQFNGLAVYICFLLRYYYRYIDSLKQRGYVSELMVLIKEGNCGSNINLKGIFEISTFLHVINSKFSPPIPIGDTERRDSFSNNEYFFTPSKFKKNRRVITLVVNETVEFDVLFTNHLSLPLELEKISITCTGIESHCETVNIVVLPPEAINFPIRFQIKLLSPGKMKLSTCSLYLFHQLIECELSSINMKSQHYNDNDSIEFIIIPALPYVNLSFANIEMSRKYIECLEGEIKNAQLYITNCGDIDVNYMTMSVEIENKQNENNDELPTIEWNHDLLSQCLTPNETLALGITMNVTSLSTSIAFSFVFGNIHSRYGRKLTLSFSIIVKSCLYLRSFDILPIDSQNKFLLSLNIDNLSSNDFYLDCFFQKESHVQFLKKLAMAQTVQFSLERYPYNMFSSTLSSSTALLNHRSALKNEEHNKILTRCYRLLKDDLGLKWSTKSKMDSNLYGILRLKQKHFSAISDIFSLFINPYHCILCYEDQSAKNNIFSSLTGECGVLSLRIISKIAEFHYFQVFINPLFNDLHSNVLISNCLIFPYIEVNDICPLSTEWTLCFLSKGVYVFNIGYNIMENNITRSFLNTVTFVVS